MWQTRPIHDSPDGRIELMRMHDHNASDLRDLLGITWENTYVEPGLMPGDVLTEAFEPSVVSIHHIKQQIEAQYEEGDARLNYYLGAFTMRDNLVGAIKVARPFKDLNRQSGKEGLLQKVKRKVMGGQPELLDPTVAEIFEVDVLPGFQNHGIGTALVNKALEDLHPDIDTVQLYTHDATVNFFERFGFSVTGERAGFPDRVKGPLNFIHMIGQRGVLHGAESKLDL